jgi:hypothetical protein
MSAISRLPLSNTAVQMTSNNISFTNQHPKYAITLDWLQVTCDKTTKQITIGHPSFQLQTMDYSTRQFKVVQILYYLGEEVATITHTPTTPKLRQSLAILKLSNKYCYGEEPAIYVQSLLKMLRLQFANITRIDIACDFQYFLNSLNPHDFIHQFVSDKLRKVQNSKVQLFYSHTTVNQYECIKFGAPSSNVKYKLYNKTKEMQDVAIKPYIRDFHASYFADTSADVWRLEFSVSNSDANYITTDGEFICNTKSLDYYCRASLGNVMAYFVNHYFTFCRNTYKSRKDREQQLPLLSIDKFSTRIYREPAGTDGARSHKIFASALQRMRNQLSNERLDLALIAQDLLTGHIYHHGLEQWAEEKHPTMLGDTVGYSRELSAPYVLRLQKRE